MSHLAILQKLADGATVDLFLGGKSPEGPRAVLETVRTDVVLSADVLGRLRAEATLRQNLDHPNLVRRLRAITSAQGRLGWLSEPVRGDTLRRYLQQRKQLAPAEALGLVLPICEAVGYLHQR